MYDRLDKGMSEVKSYALLCFWLLKYRPVQAVLRARTGKEDLPGAPERQAYNDARTYFTERFCLYMLDGLSAEYNGCVLPISDSYRQELVYNLRNADISKEALIMLFEALVPVS
jgi:hypothetical protein